MMGLDNDISLSTLVMSGVVAVVGWLLRGGMKLLVLAIQTLVKKMVETISKVDLLDAKIADILKTIGDHEKMKTDINAFYARLKKLEEEFTTFKQ